MIYFIIDEATQVIENVIVWDGESEYDPGEGKALVEGSNEPGSPTTGWKRNEDGSFEPPEIATVRFALIRRSDGVVGAVQDFPEGLAPAIPQPLNDPQGVIYAWVGCGEDVESGWTFSDGEFVVPE